MKENIAKHIDVLFERYPELDFNREYIKKAYELLEQPFLNGGKLLVAGNGGSASDAEHIVGELMKGFEKQRRLPMEYNGYGNSGDVFLGISTSGNSKNILYAAITAKVKGLKVIGLTGANDSELSKIADVTIRSSQTRTYMIQEHHLPIYHCLCLMLEERFFGEE